MVIDCVLLLFLLISIYTDLAYRKIFNITIISAIILGAGLNLVTSGISGLKYSATGIMIGFFFLFVIYLLGGVGAGDVKFMAAIGSLKGPVFVVWGGLYGAAIGGIAALLVILWQKRFFPTLKEVFTAVACFVTFRTKDSLRFDRKQAINLPYTVFLSAGMILYWLALYPK
jgi:prepilin peptidase CpaA